MLRLRRTTKTRRNIVALFLALFLISIAFSIYHLNDTDDSGLTRESNNNKKENSKRSSKLIDSLVPEKSQPAHDPSIVKDTSDKMDDKKEQNSDAAIDSELDKYPKPNYNIHAFYYPWYGNPETDGRYIHWNHEYLQHWDKKIAIKWPKGSHTPPDDIGAAFYPELGPYSSRDTGVIEEHMKQLRMAAVGVIAVSWYPPDEADGQGIPFDSIIPLLLTAADKYKIKVCLHIEPFKDRSASKLLRNLKYVIKQYGDHPAFYRRLHNGKELPLYYVYDSYQVDSQEWARLFTPQGDLSVRGTSEDGIFIGLLVEGRHRQDILLGGFDGFYTYFASNGFTYGSNTMHWKILMSDALSKNLLFIPSVGPGYDDERVRPWNAGNTKPRRAGKYYDDSFTAALAVKPPIITVTSFNEWHEGTQIEKAVPKMDGMSKYRDYLPEGADYYLSMTRKWAFKYAKIVKS